MAAEEQGEGPEGIDAEAVTAWFEETATAVERPLRFERIAGGRSNLTYAVTDASGRRWALRRPPLGERLASAHDMGREHRIIAALAGTDVPVPPVVGLCDDDSVNGAPFYVMEFVDGPILRALPDAEPYAPAALELIGERVVETLVRIHAVDPDAAGLGELGRKEDYVARQLRRWHGQWEKSTTRELPAIDRVHDRLSAAIPEQGPATLVHGDYRLDNMILAPGAEEVAAVVDWELCTLGDPLADVGLLLVYWAEPGDELVPLFEPATMAPGFPSRERVRQLYAELSGRDLSAIDYYVALGLWKLAIVLEGVFARYSQGQYGEADEASEVLGRTVDKLAQAAVQAVERLDA